MNIMVRKNKSFPARHTSRFAAFLFLLLLLFSEAISQSYYGRFSDGERVLHLIKSDNQLSAVLYQFHERDSLRKIELGGAVVSEDRFSMKAYRLDGFRFEGVFSENRNRLMLTDENGKTFALFQSYPSGSIPLDYHYDHSSKALLESGSTASRAISELGILLPRVNVNDGLQEYFNAFYGLRAETISDEENLIRSEQNRFFDQYISMNKDLADRVESINWERSQQMQVLLNDYGLLCLEKASYAYTGGAHGLARMQYLLLDIEKETPLDLKSIFESEKEQELIEMLNRKVRLHYEIEEALSLQDFGLFSNEMPLTDNMYILPGGMGFYYNHYEIGPYALGHTNLFFSFDELFTLLKKDSAVYAFAHKMMRL